MANSDKNIKITPNISQTAQPNVVFTGQGAVPITLKVLDDSFGTLSFEGSAGQLFSINNNLSTGVIFSVNDISGIPQIDVNANGTVRLVPFGGVVGVGTSSPASTSPGVDITADASNSATGQLMIKRAGTLDRFRLTCGMHTSNYGFIQAYENSIGGLVLALQPSSGTVGIGVTAPGAKLQIDTTAAATKGLIVKGFTSQSANLTEWQNSAGTLLAAVNSSGEFGIGTSPVAGRKINTNGSIVTSGSVIASFGSYDITISGTSIGRGSSGGNVSFGDPGASQAGTTIAYNTAGTTVSAGVASVVCNNAASRGLIVTAAASQTANLQEWRNSGGTALATVNASGSLATSGSITLSSGLKTSYTNEYDFLRAAPTTVGDYVEICSYFSFSNSLEVTAVSQQGAGIGTTIKKYIINSVYGWWNFTLAPIAISRQGGYESTFDFELEVGPPDGGFSVPLRLRRTAGTSARNVLITVKNISVYGHDLTPLSGTGTSAISVTNVNGAYINPYNYALPVPGTSGSGRDIGFYAGSAAGTGAGGSVILQPGAQATSGGNGVVVVRQPGGTAGTDEGQVYHDGTDLYIVNKEGGSASNSVRLQTNAGYGVYVSNRGTGAYSYLDATSGTLVLAYQANLSISFWAISGSTGWLSTYNDAYRLHWPGSGLLSNAGAILSITGGSTSGTSNGGSLAFASSSPSGYSANQNDLVLTGSAFQRLSGTAARDITGVAPPSGGSHVDGRMMRIYNVGSFNLTLKHNSTSSTAANRFFCIQSVDIIVSANDFAELIYDSTNNGSGAAGWRVA